jgi:hypothetical protein
MTFIFDLLLSPFTPHPLEENADMRLLLRLVAKGGRIHAIPKEAAYNKITVMTTTLHLEAVRREGGEGG